MRTSLWGLVSLALGSAATSKKPNVVYIVTDDQDQMLGGSFPEVEGMGTPLPKTKRLLVDEGATFSNAFIHVPICNPSRSTTLTGRYFHNVKTTNVSWAAMHVNMDIVHNASFGLELHQNGSQSSANISFDAPDFHELFDTAADPWCTTNAYETADGGARAALDDELAAWFRCAGADCP